MIVADDLGYNDIGAFGSPSLNTPALDRLARDGMKMNQFYSTGPVCTPSRAAMFTGRLPIRSGVYTDLGWPFDNILRVFYPSSIGGLPLNETVRGDVSSLELYASLVGIMFPL